MTERRKWRTKEEREAARAIVIRSESDLMMALMELCRTIDDAAEYISVDIQNLEIASREWRNQ
jgi:hypothetical protein